MRYLGLLQTYKEYLPVTDRTPLLTLQEGNTPLVRAENLSEELGLDLYFKYEGLNPTGSFKDRGMVMAIPETVATAIRIGNPSSWTTAVAAAEESGGQIYYVTDAEILHAYRMIASREGLFAEPASAASIAGVMKLKREGAFRGGETVVCVLTGHGLKDPNIAIKTVNADPLVVEDSEAAVMETISRLEGEA